MLYYFAYGSNMLDARLQERVPSAKAIGAASLDGYRLVFHKKSKDGSVKCDLVSTASSKAYGVLFSMQEEELPSLDRAEGVGFGYLRVERHLQYQEESVEAFLYLAQEAYIDSTGLPYDWYLQFVLQGAKQNGLPHSYIQKIEKTPYQIDRDENRSIKNQRTLSRGINRQTSLNS